MEKCHFNRDHCHHLIFYLTFKTGSNHLLHPLFSLPEGPERRSAEIDKKNKLITAYHESGHAIVAYYTKDAMPINKATIMPRGPSLGHVRQHKTSKLSFDLSPVQTVITVNTLSIPFKVSMLPENDRWSETRSQLLAQMDVSMGGRVAEEIIFGHEYITTGKKGLLNEPESFFHDEEKWLTGFCKCNIHIYGFFLSRCIK